MLVVRFKLFQVLLDSTVTSVPVSTLNLVMSWPLCNSNSHMLLLLSLFSTVSRYCTSSPQIDLNDWLVVVLH